VFHAVCSGIRNDYILGRARLREKLRVMLRFFVAGGVGMLALAADQRSKATVDRWMPELSNWGRWGKNDRLEIVNLITPAKAKPPRR
jgi:hypothetical protein